MYTTATSDGLRISSQADGVRFGDALVSCVQLVDIRSAIQSGGLHAVIGVHAFEDHPVVVTSDGKVEILTTMKGYGRNATFITSTDRYVVLPETTRQREKRLEREKREGHKDRAEARAGGGYSYDRNGALVAVPSPYEGTSQGIVGVGFDGLPLWLDAQLHGHLMMYVKGVRILNWMTDGRWTVGTEVEDAANDRVLLYNSQTDELFIASDEKVQVLTQVVELMDGSPLVSVPGGWRTLADCRPWTSAVPPVPVDMPSVDEVPDMGEFTVLLFVFKEQPYRSDSAVIPVWRDSSDDYIRGLPLVVPAEDKASLVDDENLWAVLADEHGPEGEPNPRDARSAEEAIEAARPIADERGYGLAVYQDGMGIRQTVLDLIEDTDLVSTPHYRNKGESLDDFVDRSDAEMGASSQVCDYFPCFGLHNRSGDLTTSEIAWALVRGLQLAKQHGLEGCLVFADGRDGVPAEIWPYIDRLLEKSWPAEPRFLEDEPVDPPDPPIEPPVEPPIEPPVEPPVEETDDMVSISVQNIMPGDAVNEVPHPDGNGLIGLQRLDGKYLTIEPGGQWRWSDNLGAWEQFYPGAHYTAQRDGATWILPKGGSW